jgi:hypothetical protein
LKFMPYPSLYIDWYWSKHCCEALVPYSSYYIIPIKVVVKEGNLITMVLKVIIDKKVSTGNSTTDCDCYCYSPSID